MFCQSTKKLLKIVPTEVYHVLFRQVLKLILFTYVNANKLKHLRSCTCRNISLSQVSPILGQRWKPKCQQEILKESFRANLHPTKEERSQLATSLNTSQEVINAWFINRRRKKGNKRVLKKSE